jgi:hypothetical protein
MGGSSSTYTETTVHAPEVWSRREPNDDVKEGFKEYSLCTIPQSDSLPTDLTKYPETCKELKKLYDKNVGFVGKILDNNNVYTKLGQCTFEQAIGPTWDQKTGTLVPTRCRFYFKVPLVYAMKVIKIYEDENERLTREREAAYIAAEKAKHADHIAFLEDD